MKFQRDALSAKHLEHVHEVREGARGAHRRAGGRLWLQLTAGGGRCAGRSSALLALGELRDGARGLPFAGDRAPARRARRTARDRQAQAAELPEDRADLMLHSFDGGGVNAWGPALLVRKSLLNKVSLFGTYYVDIVSNASIDVVTTASPYQRNAPRVRLRRRLRRARLADHPGGLAQHRARLRRHRLQRRRRDGGLRRHDDGRASATRTAPTTSARKGEGFFDQRQALALPGRRDADPDAALARQRELRGRVGRRLPRQPVSRRPRLRRRRAGAHCRARAPAGRCSSA